MRMKEYIVSKFKDESGSLDSFEIAAIIFILTFISGVLYFKFL